MAMMDKDEFAEWLEEHKDEAIDSLSERPRSLSRWLLAFYGEAKALAPKPYQESVAVPDDDDDLDEDGDLDEDDEEEGE